MSIVASDRVIFCTLKVNICKDNFILVVASSDAKFAYKNMSNFSRGIQFRSHHRSILHFELRLIDCVCVAWK